MKSIALNSLSKLLVIIIFLSITSCAVPREEIAYFQDESLSTALKNENDDFEIVYKPDDLLTIDVASLDPEAAKPFNLPAVSYNSSSVISAQGNLKMQTYLIDAKGNIEFPVLGTVNIGGLSRSEANNMMKEKLTEYLKDPIVNIRLANFTITVIGEVARPGTFTVVDEKISISRALGLAGDLTIYGQRNNVLLIREINGEKKYAKIDLTSVNVFNSKNYYLTQNDVIYVEPNNARRRQSAYNQNTIVIISAVSTLAAIVALIIK